MSSATPLKVLIMAGGTGGHVIPALSVAQVLKSHGVQVEWLGTQAGIEARLVPASGIPIHWMNITGLRGKSAATLLLAPFRLLSAVMQARRVIKQMQPDAVLGMGGFASGPGGLAARLLGRRLVIHEQNAIAGMTNRYLARMAHATAYAFEGAFERGNNLQHLGNPVRAEIEDLPAPQERAQNKESNTVNVLILGGSLGAKALNDVLPEALQKARLVEQLRVRHQAGSRNIEEAKVAYSALSTNTQAQVEVKDFIDDMAAAYAWADLVVCRAGALTVAELAAAGVASILVPYPFAVDDHQTLNAQVLQRAGASLVCQQADLTAELLAGLFDQFCEDRERLLLMGEAARSVAEPRTAERLAALCLPQLEQVIHESENEGAQA
ncbi:MAG: undecaprenyldiphospho-muramoylpentapeptide beta-N-acetylglucosaminyltransferase [Gammaproteobacteria bacterium]|nr:undecaprenyldiphospho-muramoylpentapeptide beta-N-acetylglucosaminyltransferase [Gammaproteobacteria bacterium]